MPVYTYTDEQLADAVRKSQSVAGVMRVLGVRPSGGSHSHITRRIQRADLDTGHFTRQAHNKGKTAYNRKTAADILVLRPDGGSRQHAEQLRRALVEVGIPYVCARCELGPRWQGEKLTLQVDHINDNWLDDRQENLQFLCPNCHAVK